MLIFLLHPQKYILEMRRKARFSKQTKEETIKHLRHILKDKTIYDISTDPLQIHIEIKECIRQPKEASDKRKRIKKEYQSQSKKKRRLSGTRKRIKPKIRTVKKGRTVNLKGVSY
jgi:hypothetical protein